jgi:hypothetical protein
MFGSLPGEKRIFSHSELKLNFEMSNLSVMKGKGNFVPMASRVRVVSKEKGFQGKQVAYIDHTVPNSIMIQSKSIKGVIQ